MASRAEIHVPISPTPGFLTRVRMTGRCAIGALSLVRRSTPPLTTWAGSPARALGVRSRRLLELEALVGTPAAS